MKPETNQSPAPQNDAGETARTESGPAAASAIVPSVSGGCRPSSVPHFPGEAYTRMPEFSKPVPPRWVYFAVSAVLALVLALGMLYVRRSPPASSVDRPSHADSADVPSAAQRGATESSAQ